MNLLVTLLTFCCLLDRILSEDSVVNEPLSFPLIHSRVADGTFVRNWKLNKANLEKKAKEFKQHAFWNFRVTPSPLLDYSDDFYLVNISMGTPPQSFLLMPSTLFSDIWVIDAECTDEYCIGSNKTLVKHPFDRKASRTYIEDKKMDEIETNLFVADVGSDILRVGELTGRQKFMIATTMYNDEALDGFLGLGWPARSMVPGAQPPIITLMRLMTEKVITVWMKSRKLIKDPENGGQITFGGRDAEHCQSNWKYAPLYSSQLDYWQFQISGFSIGGLNNHRKRQAISALEFFGIFAPVGVAKALAEEIKADYHADYGFYTVKCDAKNLPDLVIKIDDNDFPVPASEYVLDFSDTNPEFGKNTCVLGVIPYENYGGGPAWILGNPFTRTYCTVFDIANKRMGYASVKITDT